MSPLFRVLLPGTRADLIPAPSTNSRLTPALVLLLVALSWPGHALAQTGSNKQSTEPTSSASPTMAPIVIDGRTLFSVRGITSYPAQERVKQLRKNFIEAARDLSISAEDIKLVEKEERTAIMAGDKSLMQVFDADADVEGIDRQLLAGVYLAHITKAIKSYRHDRSTPVLLRNSGFALVATALMAFLLWITLRLTRKLEKWALRHVGKNLKDLANKSHQLIRAAQVWGLVAALLRGLRILLVLLLVYFYLNSVLGLYPWTRPAAVILFDLILNPLQSLWHGLLAAIPNLSFLVILFFVVRYILKLTRLFFDGVRSGRIKLQNFDADWALPTYKIVRLLIIAFSIVVAYPYIPGSDSMAFKGVSLFLGVIVSLGSSSFIANIMAGLSMTYRGAFKEGDRIKIGDVQGRVEDIKLMITRVRTHKNEIVVIPNSNILNTNVINYTNLVNKKGLVLHTVVGIGYDTPWRQVEAMLVQAAERTSHLKKDPAPFVLQLSLGDYAINYELNAYCDDEQLMPSIYSEMHANIQDVFNEHGVQIMSPAYVHDPESPKLVPPDQWYPAPAVKPE